MGQYSDRENYLKTLCEDHPLVAHDAAITNSTKKT
jgi:hypothetical protein